MLLRPPADRGELSAVCTNASHCHHRGILEPLGLEGPAITRLTAAIEEVLMATPISGTVKSFDTPDDHVTKGGVEIDVLQVGDMKVKRATYPSGWRFSTHMGAPKCQDTHVGYTVSGHMIAELGDGTRLQFDPGNVFVIPAGHDAWVAA